MIQICLWYKTAQYFSIACYLYIKSVLCCQAHNGNDFMSKEILPYICQRFISPKKIITQRVIIFYRVCQSRFTERLVYKSIFFLD